MGFDEQRRGLLLPRCGEQLSGNFESAVAFTPGQRHRCRESQRQQSSVVVPFPSRQYECPGERALDHGMGRTFDEKQGVHEADMDIDFRRGEGVRRTHRLQGGLESRPRPQVVRVGEGLAAVLKAGSYIERIDRHRRHAGTGLDDRRLVDEHRVAHARALGFPTGAGVEKRPEIVGELPCRLVALGPVLCHRTQAYPFEGLGNVRVDPRRRLGLDLDDLAIELFLVGGDERQRAAEHAVEHDPEAVDVTARTDRVSLPGNLLR